VRRLILLIALAGCAQPGMPPGGPPDLEPPRLIRITPDTNAVNVRASGVTFEFDEVVSERPQGARSLAEAFEISPSTGPIGVSWRRSRIEVRPRGGLQPNTTYTVRMLPGMVDLANNVDSAGATVVFSTGPALASGVVEGRVFDWAMARPAPSALVQAIALPDSATWSATADSSGAFAIRHMTPGTYLLRALVDQNRNRVVDPRELLDSVTITLADSFRREMLAAIRDSLGPALSTAEARDTLMVRVSLDRPLDTLFVATAGHFSLKAADSSVVPVADVITQAQMDRIAADSVRLQAVQDSVRRAFVADSTRAADSARVAADPARATGRRPDAPTRAPPAPAVDSAPPTPPPVPTARIPATRLYLRLAQPLKPETVYRLRAEGLVGVTGATRNSERVFTTPKARPDTAARRGTGRP
jgi:hypothetical protein